MTSGVYLFLEMVFLGLLSLTVATVICYIRCPKENSEEEKIKPPYEEKTDRPAKLASAEKCSFCGWEMNPQRDKVCPNCGVAPEKEGDWSSGFGEDKPAGKIGRASCRERVFLTV